MPRVPIDDSHRTGEGGDRFPKLKLDKDEKARIVLFEQPWMEWVHALKAPEFEEDGKVIKEEKTKRSGEKYLDYRLGFIGQPICLGDAGVLADKGVDEKNCPACAAAVQSGGSVPKPIQRFASNVVRYDLRAPTWDMKVPFGANILVWAYTARIYDALLDLQNQIGDLRYHDIALECQDAVFQRHTMTFRLNPGWQETPDENERKRRAAYIKELVTTPGNKATDEQLRDACGRETTRTYMQEDVDTCIRRWNKASHAASTSADPTGDTQLGGAEDVNAGLDALMRDVDERTAQAAERTAQVAERAAQIPGVDPFAMSQQSTDALSGDPFAEFQPPEQPDTDSEQALQAAAHGAEAAARAAETEAAIRQPQPDSPFGNGSAPPQEPAPPPPPPASQAHMAQPAAEETLTFEQLLEGM